MFASGWSKSAFLISLLRRLFLRFVYSMSTIMRNTQLAEADLLIIDELNHLTFNRYQSKLLFKVITDRTERKSVIVSMNLKFSDCVTTFKNKTIVTALIAG